MMSSSHQKLFYKVVLYSLHPLDAAAAAALTAEIIHCHSLDITQIRHGYNRIFSGNHIFCRNIIDVITDGSPALIAVFF